MDAAEDGKDESEISINFVHYHTPFKCQRNTLVQVLRMEAATTSCLLLATRRATVTVASGDAISEAPVASYELPGGGKSGPSLVDAVLMEDASAVAFALSNRTLHFYDTSCSRRSDAAQEHRHAWRVIGLKSCITSMWYHPGETQSTLFLGDEQGAVTTITFLQPSLLLFSHKSSDSQAGRAETIYWPELFEEKGAHAALARALTQRKVHAEPVLQVFFCPAHQVVLSCSLDANKSMRMCHADRRLPSYKFSVEMGVRRFAFDAQRFEVASASDDGIIRIWNPLVPRTPVLTLQTHDAPIVDVLYSGRLLFSVCKNAEFRIWESNGALMRKVQLEVPTSPKWSGAKNIFAGGSGTILVSLGPNLAEIGLGAPEPSFRNSPTDADSASSRCSSALKFGLDIEQTASELPSRQISLNKEFGFIEPDMKIPHMPMSALQIFNERMSKEADETSELKTPGINERIEKQERILAKRRYFVEECAPHLALSLCDPGIVAPSRVPKLVLQTNFNY
ncbi:Hypothetical predicted protein [Cloeon dipterum]|uniref:Uncharacterized protein n=1 Tax=Cloeon dipterum TaxID=197152 RepID=A0A8S1CIN1_9INSE|nr:Hypothetical predicted protein [Cloeon dipterum]